MNAMFLLLRESDGVYVPRWYDAEDLRWAVRHWATRLGVKIPAIYIRPMDTKWASISTTGRMMLNAELLDLPKELGEFVILHELVHLLVPNHGRVFKSFMYAYMPDWERRERQLQAHVSKPAEKKAGKTASKGNSIKSTQLQTRLNTK